MPEISQAALDEYKERLIESNQLLNEGADKLMEAARYIEAQGQQIRELEEKRVAAEAEAFQKGYFAAQQDAIQLFEHHARQGYVLGYQHAMMHFTAKFN